jgi:hypothetical protein
VSCPCCPHCATGSRTSPTDIELGHKTPVFKPARTTMLLQIAAPTGALDAILRWVEGLRGKRGPTTQPMTFVGHDDEWTKLLIHREPEVFGGSRRGNGLDTDPPPAPPSPLT